MRRFLDKRLQSEHDKLLIELGCPVFRLDDFIEYLDGLAEDKKLTCDPDLLCDCYRLIHHHLNQLSGIKSRHRQKLIERIKALPIYLTEGGRLQAISDAQNPLFLTSEAVPTVIDLDNQLATGILEEDLRRFFEKTLGVARLTDEKYIETYITQYYEALDSTDQKFALLDFVRVTDAKKELSCLDQLKQIKLVRCADGGYRKPSEVFFPSELLDSIFTEGYSAPHSEYEIPKSDKQSESQWFSLFSRLGVKQTPQPHDLHDAIEQIVKTPPTVRNIDQLHANSRLRRKTNLATEIGVAKMRQDDGSTVSASRRSVCTP